MRFVIASLLFAASACGGTASSSGQNGGGATGGHAAGGTDAAGGSGATGSGGADAAGGQSGGGAVGFDGCTNNTECIVVPASCCGSCGVATRDDAVALHRDRATEYRGTACEELSACLPCADDPDPTLVATCAAGRCEVVDLLDHDVTACSSAKDCRLRAQSCCECGANMGPGDLIAVRADAETAYQDLVCLPLTACPLCVPVYPEQAQAACSTDGHCVVEW